jgi:hypothetical protein
MYFPQRGTYGLFDFVSTLLEILPPNPAVGHTRASAGFAVLTLLEILPLRHLMHRRTGVYPIRRVSTLLEILPLRKTWPQVRAM